MQLNGKAINRQQWWVETLLSFCEVRMCSITSCDPCRIRSVDLPNSRAMMAAAELATLGVGDSMLSEDNRKHYEWTAAFVRHMNDLAAQLLQGLR
jgi:hypothetical protein